LHKAKRAGETEPARLSNFYVSCGLADFSSTASRQAEKTTASHHQARQTRAYDGTWYVDVDNARWRPGCVPEEYVGNKADAGRIRGVEITNRCIANGKRDSSEWS